MNSVLHHRDFSLLPEEFRTELLKLATKFYEEPKKNAVRVHTQTAKCFFTYQLGRCSSVASEVAFGVAQAGPCSLK